ncbi:MAG: DUF3536 domain-containing protein, partial [Saprospiraceae bacterium]
QVTALRLLEMQRYAVFMYTSCGWFFDEISGIETNQILQYALRAMDHAQDCAGLDLHAEFETRLREAPSNKYADGAASYRQNVLPARVNLERVAAHFAVASLFEDDPARLDLFNYTATVEAFERIEAGTPRLAIGRLRIRSRLTLADLTFSFSALYLGQQHIIGNISSTVNRASFDDVHRRVAEAFREANLGAVITIQQEHFGPHQFTLATLFADEKIKIIRAITANSLLLAEANFRNVFNDNYQLMTGLQEAGLPLPDTWRNIASYVLNDNLLQFFGNSHTANVQTLRRVADDLKNWKVKLADEEAVRHASGLRIHREIQMIEGQASSLARVQWLADVLEIMVEMKLEPDIWRSQNIFYLVTKGLRKQLWEFWNAEWKAAFERLAVLLRVRL